MANRSRTSTWCIVKMQGAVRKPGGDKWERKSFKSAYKVLHCVLCSGHSWSRNPIMVLCWLSKVLLLMLAQESADWLQHWQNRLPAVQHGSSINSPRTFSAGADCLCVYRRLFSFLPRYRLPVLTVLLMLDVPPQIWLCCLGLSELLAAPAAVCPAIFFSWTERNGRGGEAEENLFAVGGRWR